MHAMKLSTALLLLSTAVATAQPTRTNTPSSPLVLPDRRVTFRVHAPKATEVSLFGDWMDPQGANQPMTKDEHGDWTVTVGPLEPGLDIYTYTIDGVTGPDPLNPRIKLRARTSASLVDVPGDPPAMWQARDVPHGIVEVNWRASKVAGDTRAYYVYTPPGYSAASATRYPVLYLLHGNNDTAVGWSEVGKANFILDNLLAEKKAVPMIIVMPWGHVLPYDAPQGNNNALFERYLLDEVIPQVEAKYHVAPGRENRAIAGLSMGGGQSLLIGLGHLDLFSAVCGFSAAVPANPETRFKALLDDSDGTNAKLKLLWLACGRQDSLFPRSQQFVDLFTAHKVKEIGRASCRERV